ncbi:unnamed protein product [Hymenolepis diminuta]|uniref:Glypican-3 n=1 Tax=Hymenolepis diminuta TaxID=6216 RepID=A0A0R3SPY1_HYMDI|nr:unnamed protein product [Hymenolepis diminuta]
MNMDTLLPIYENNYVFQLFPDTGEGHIVTDIAGASHSPEPLRFGGGRGASAVWEFMKRTKMTGRVFYLLRSIVHLIETTKTLEYLQWLLQELSSFDLGSQGCNRMLMRMRHCSLCAGYPLVHPCPSFCETTLTHCLRPINKLQPPWTNLINTLYEQLQNWLNPSGLMLKNVIIYSPKAILEFQRVIVKSVQDVIPLDCRYTYNLIEGRTDRFPDVIPNPGRTQSSVPSSIHTQFMRISHKMQTLKRLWISAPSKICRESPHLSLSTTASSQNCWNGSTVGPYLTSDWRDKNDFYVSQWTFYPSPYTDKSALNRATSDTSNEHDTIEKASKNLMILNCKLKQAFPRSDFEKKNETGKSI